MPTVIATFETRREADLAVEHLVQEHGVDRGDITVGPDGDDNSAGEAIGGADTVTDFQDDDDADPALGDAIALSVEAEDDDQAEAILEVLEEFGGGDARTED